MLFVLQLAVLIAATAVCLMCILLAFEAVAGVIHLSRLRVSKTTSPVADHLDLSRAVVLIPAHNEAEIIRRTIDGLAGTKARGASILVVADNCSDDTARIAAEAGADVVERRDLTNRGKGFALAFGVEHLAKQAPETVVVLDADCSMLPASIASIVGRSRSTGRVVQARYQMLLENPDAATAKERMSAMAWRLKVDIRQAGLYSLFGACHLSGSGMAFPWPVISQMPLGTASTVEDLVLGLWLAAERKAAIFDANASTESFFPVAEASARSQRQRWESGHLKTITNEVPATLLRGLQRTSLQAVALSLDAALPPLSFLVLILAAVGSTTLAVALFSGFWWPVAIVLAAGNLLLAVILIAIYSDPERNIRAVDFMKSFSYIFSKIGIYTSVLRGQSEGWVKTLREKRKD